MCKTCKSSGNFHAALHSSEQMELQRVVRDVLLEQGDSKKQGRGVNHRVIKATTGPDAKH
jgi:hypothetical protein